MPSEMLLCISNHPTSHSEILIEGLLRHSKHIEHYSEQKRVWFLPLQSWQPRGRNGHFSSSLIRKCEIVALSSTISKRHIVLLRQADKNTAVLEKDQGMALDKIGLGS